jgi:RHS repeat-associated protein
VNTYTYDPANRLLTVNGPLSTVSYAYNGLGDRLQTTANSVTTTFAMDYNAGLPQVLDDGTNIYLYGNGRIAQVNTGTEYFLGDALGSVRQMADASGAIKLAKSYDPYGVTAQSVGSSPTSYGFGGEMSDDETGLIYLRARYYSSDTGRFMTRDTWDGDAQQPMSYNRWNYTNSNPVNYTDPSGNCPEGSSGAGCRDLAASLEAKYHFTIYWPGRTVNSWGKPIGMVRIDGIPVPSDMICSVSSTIGTKPWTTSNLNQLRIGLELMERVLGYGGTRRLTSDGIIFVMNPNYHLFDSQGLEGYYVSGEHYPPSYPDKEDNLNLRFLGGFQYAIGYRDWDEYQANNLFRAHFVVHEFGHRAADIYNSLVPGDIEGSVWDTFSSNGAPSMYAKSKRSEYFAEAFSFYIWIWRPKRFYTHNDGQFNDYTWDRMLPNGHNPTGFPYLTKIMNKNGSQSLYDFFKTVVIPPLSSRSVSP